MSLSWLFQLKLKKNANTTEIQEKKKNLKEFNTMQCNAAHNAETAAAHIELQSNQIELNSIVN